MTARYQINSTQTKGMQRWRHALRDTHAEITTEVRGPVYSGEPSPPPWLAELEVAFNREDA